MIHKEEIQRIGFKYTLQQQSSVVAHAYVYILTNDLHEAPFAFIEDVYVDESVRGNGIGTVLIEHILQEAKQMGCYKILCTSRMEKREVHSLYEKLHFRKHGFEFRQDL